MKRLGWAMGISAVAALVLALLSLENVRGDQILHFGFEGRDPVWVQGRADAPFKELEHRITDEHFQSGKHSEFIRLQAEQGSFIHYTFDVGKAPVTDELSVRLYVRANRPKIQLLARVVLPHERDPRNNETPLTVLIPGDPEKLKASYKLVSRWERLAIPEPVKRLREQQQLLREELKRDVNVEDAYVDQLVLNVYGGPGLTEVWTDELEIGPIVEAKPSAADKGGRTVPGKTAVNRRAGEVQLRGNQLLVSGDKFFLLGIRHSGTPLAVLKKAGFNTVWLDENTAPGVIEDAIAKGFWVVPTVTPPDLAAEREPSGGGRVEGQLTADQTFGKTVARFLDQEAILCWDLGSNLTAEQFPKVARTVRAFQAADPMRPLAADVWDGFRNYSAGVDQQLLLGVHRWPLLTSLELTGYRDWLTSRRRLATGDPYTWTWVQTHLPDWFTMLAYDKPNTANFQEPLGPQPEQIRLLAYTAIGSGCRGLGFWSDRFLADSHSGRDRLLALALLNQEIKMLEPLLVTAKEPYWIDTRTPEVKAAVIRCDRAILVLPIWVGPGAQFVPGQSALTKLVVPVPGVPQSWQPWEISPGRVQSLNWTPGTHGEAEVTLREFDLTSAIVFSSDTNLWVQFQNRERQMQQEAAQWSHDLAQEELVKVEKVEAELEGLGAKEKDGKKLLEKSREYLASSEQHSRNNEHADAYADARRALRPLRILMRAQWDRAVRDLDNNAVASPYAVSYYTLPRHWQLMQQVKQAKADTNVLPGGDFEAPPDKSADGWMVQEAPTLDPVTASARRVTDDPQQGKQCLLFEVKPKEGVPAPQALERTFLAVHSPAVRLPAGSLVRISAWVQVPQPITASTDGALIYDSAGGEPLAVRFTGATKWKQYIAYRKVPPSGSINVTLAMTGLGKVYFDDVRIEPLQSGEAGSSTSERRSGLSPYPPQSPTRK
jgi:hypothetical protein